MFSGLHGLDNHQQAQFEAFNSETCEKESQEMSSDEDEEEESKLGRHEHWEETYATELANLADTGDEGEIWFGEDVLETMVDWTDELLQRRLPNAHEAKLLDLGTGNGSFLFALAELGYKNLTGSDYSEQGIRLAKAIAKKRAISHIYWVQDNLLSSSISERFQVLTDKGTLDAVGLMANAKEQRAVYQEAVHKLLSDNGLLIITSCNSTAQELQAEFCGPSGARFKFVDKVRTYPTFKFGGVEGSRVCTVTFQKA